MEGSFPVSPSNLSLKQQVELIFFHFCFSSIFCTPTIACYYLYFTLRVFFSAVSETLQKQPDIMLETQSLKSGYKSHQKKTLKKIHTPYKRPLCFSLALPVLTFLFPPLTPHTVGRTEVSYLASLLCRLRTEHWVRHRGAGRKDILLIWLPFWPYIWWLRPSASSTFIHGRDPGRAAVCGPLEEISWHWDRDDHHESRQVRHLWLSV